MATPTVEQLGRLLQQGRPDDIRGPKFSTDTAQLALDIATDLVNAYTRSRGFVAAGFAPDAAVGRVILLVASRIYANPENIRQESSGDYAYTYAEPVGFTLAELAVLNNYRRRAA